MLQEQKLILKQKEMKALEAIERKKKLEFEKLAKKKEMMQKIEEDEK